MEHAPAIYALQRLHADLGGQIQANRNEAQRLAQAMIHVEAVLKMLDPTFNVRAISAKRRNRVNPLFKKGEIFRHVLSVLREAPGPLTAREIAEGLYRSRGVDNPTLDQVRGMFGAVNRSLRNHQGKTVEAVGEGMPAKWRVKENDQESIRANSS